MKQSNLSVYFPLSFSSYNSLFGQWILLGKWSEMSRAESSTLCAVSSITNTHLINWAEVGER
jgi:hypothetical protein